jgi:hypothetical protein
VLRATLIAVSILVFGLRPAGTLAGEAPENECSEIDVRADLGDPRVQDGTSWCYAHSAADLLTEAVGKRISSYDLAITYLLGNEKKLRKTGNARVLDYLRSHPDFEQRVHDSRLEEEAYQPEPAKRTCSTTSKPSAPIIKTTAKTTSPPTPSARW